MAVHQPDPPTAGHDQQSGSDPLSGATPHATHLVRLVAHQLAEAVPSPQADARLLVAHAAEVPVNQLITARLGAPQQERLATLVQRRLAGEPVQHLTGRAGFRHLELQVGPGAFIPRPETEVMVGWCLDRLRERAARHPDEHPLVVVDLCTGSGAIAAALADELSGAHAEPALQVELHAVELSPEALVWAERNLTGTGVHLQAGDLTDALPELDGRCDLVVCNPPYVPLESWESVPAEVRDFDPSMALFSGDDGLDAWRQLAHTAHRLLKDGGVLAGEHADLQGESVPEVLLAHGGWDQIRDHRDLTQRPRFTTAIRRATR